MVLTGLIRNIFPEEAYGNSERQFRKTIVWLQEINTKYPQCWSVEFFNDDAKVLKHYDTGTLVNVNIAVLGKLSTKNGEEKVFNTIRALKIEKIKTSK